jgi:hypothetical protein
MQEAGALVLGRYSEGYPLYPEKGDLTLETIKRDVWLSQMAEARQTEKNQSEETMEQSDNSLPVQVHGALAVRDVVNNVTFMQEIMGAVMKEGEHYGCIPGTGDKPSLLKSGAEKLAHTFQLAPRYTIERTDLPGGHREYEVVCEIMSVATGNFLGSGVGVCSTMESKYRFRSTNTGREVPREYWNTRDSSILGGPQFSPRKIDGKWIVFERIEHDNPADHYNTVKKMAKKRAFVDGVLTVTAASDLFTQDLEDLKANGVVDAEFTEKSGKGQDGKPAGKGGSKPKGGSRDASQNQMNYLADLAKKALGDDMGEEALSALKAVHGPLSSTLASKIINNLQNGNAQDLKSAIDQAADAGQGYDGDAGGQGDLYPGPEEPPIEAYEQG